MADMPLPQAAIAALQRGDKLAAIRIVREATGVDLKRAAVAVEMHGRRHLATSTSAGASGRQDTAQQILDSLLGGKKTEALKLLRDQVNQSGSNDLKSALQTAERLFGAQRSDTAAEHMQRSEHRNEHRLDAERARDSARLQVLIHEKRVPTVSPGDVPGGGLVWVLVAMAAALMWLILAVLGG